MGKGDKKTKRGKITRGTSGVRRSQKKKQTKKKGKSLIPKPLNE